MCFLVSHTCLVLGVEQHLQCTAEKVWTSEVWRKFKGFKIVQHGNVLSLLREKSITIGFHLLQTLHQVVVGHLHLFNFV